MTAKISLRKVARRAVAEVEWPAIEADVWHRAMFTNHVAFTADDTWQTTWHLIGAYVAQEDNFGSASILAFATPIDAAQHFGGIVGQHTRRKAWKAKAERGKALAPAS